MFDYKAFDVRSFLIFKNEAYPIDNINSYHTLHVLVYKQSTLDRYTTDELIEQNIYDKRYDLTYDELKAMNFTITYTGD